ncbi:MAG: hypothetical protein KDB00_19645 [Planctomycetales bacterium]|nr:hypothetical protein [Planctomycetales bacterium]
MKDTISVEAATPSAPSPLSKSLQTSGATSAVDRSVHSGAADVDEAIGPSTRFDAAERSLSMSPPRVSTPRVASPAIHAVMEASHLVRNAVRVTAVTLCVVCVYLILLHPESAEYMAVGLPLCVVIIGSLRLLAMVAGSLDRNRKKHAMHLGSRIYRLMVEIINLAMITLGALILACSVFYASILQIPSLGVASAVALLLFVLIDPPMTPNGKRRETDHRNRTRLQRQALESLQIARHETQAVAKVRTGPAHRSSTVPPQNSADRNHLAGRNHGE